MFIVNINNQKTNSCLTFVSVFIEIEKDIKCI